MNTSFPPHVGTDNPTTVAARFAAGTIIVQAEYVDWLDDTLVRLEIPGLSSPLMLRGFEARELGQALQEVAFVADAATSHEMHRSLGMAAAPAADGLGSGL